MSSVPEAIQKMRSTLAEGGNLGASWDQLWKDGSTPWDADSAAGGALLGLMTSQDPDEAAFRAQLPRGSGTCLIAGCGRGYDAVVWARDAEMEVVAVDVSDTAVQAARKWLDQQAIDGSLKERIEFEQADFFNMPATDSFDAAYDYTFFCAIPPTSRRAWGQKYADMILEGGMLLALMFPLDGDRQGGPPFSVSLEAYQEVLGEHFELVATHTPKCSVESHIGREQFSLWRRKA